MKIPNIFILNSLYNGDPKVTPLTFGWLEYTKKVREVIVNEFIKEIGAEPIKNSPLDLRISMAAKNYAKVARKHFKAKKGNYKRATAQPFFKCTTHVEEKVDEGDHDDEDVGEDEAVTEGSNDDETKNAGDVSNFHFDQETNMINVPVKKEVKQEIKSEPMDEVEGIHHDASLPEV